MVASLTIESHDCLVLLVAKTPPQAKSYIEKK